MVNNVVYASAMRRGNCVGLTETFSRKVDSSRPEATHGLCKVWRVPRMLFQSYQHRGRAVKGRKSRRIVSSPSTPPPTPVRGDRRRASPSPIPCPSPILLPPPPPSESHCSDCSERRQKPPTIEGRRGERADARWPWRSPLRKSNDAFLFWTPYTSPSHSPQLCTTNNTRFPRLIPRQRFNDAVADRR